MPNRREFLKRGAYTLAGTVWGLPPVLHATGRPILRAGDPTLRELAMRALDAARSAGAVYADVRFTSARSQRFFSGNPATDEQRIAVGVRALAGGFWGFAASPEWTSDEVARLGRQATEQAKANSWGATRAVQLDAPPPPALGSWTTPHLRDPFEVADEEKMDYIRAAHAYVSTFRNASANSVISFKREERTFASTDGAFCTQTIYTALGNGSYFSVDSYDPVTNQSGSRTAEFCSPTAGGYEILTGSDLLDAIPRLYEGSQRQLNSVPITLGRYDVVFDAMAVADILSQSIGVASEIDRVLGFEVNAGGGSYLGPWESALGNQLYSPLLNVTANRSHPTGAASVRWDDDGVVPDDFTLVKGGVLSDYATSREHVAALTPWYRSHAISPRSHGCAAAGDAGDFPLVYTPNLRMTPGARDADFQELVSNVQKGLAVIGGGCNMDYRQLTGRGGGEAVYEIRNGKLGNVVAGGEYLIRATEFWKNVVAIGGAKSLAWRGREFSKGEPPQRGAHSVGAVPISVRNVLFMDDARRGG